MYVGQSWGSKLNYLELYLNVKIFFVDPGVYIYVYTNLDYFFPTQVMLPDDLFFSYEFNLLQFVSVLVWRLLNLPCSTSLCRNTFSRPQGS